MNFGIIAAGEGSRLAGEGVATPKPLLPICGMPMIERLIRIFEKNGAETINVVINGFMPEVKEFLTAFKTSPGVSLNLKVRTTPSSMHTFYELSEMMPSEGRFIATTVDTIFREEDFSKYVAAFADAGDNFDGMMAVTSYIEDEKPLYVRTDEQMNITGFLDRNEDDCKFISGGIYGLDGKAFPILKECIENGISRMRNFQRALVDGGLHLKAYKMGKIIDVDHASDIARAEEFLAEK